MNASVSTFTTARGDRDTPEFEMVGDGDGGDGVNSVGAIEYVDVLVDKADFFSCMSTVIAARGKVKESHRVVSSCLSEVRFAVWDFSEVAEVVLTDGPALPPLVREGSDSNANSLIAKCAGRPFLIVKNNKLKHGCACHSHDQQTQGSMTESLAPLTAAAVVCRGVNRDVDALDHVVLRISAFLDHALPQFWRISRACACGRHVSLLKRLAALESPTMDPFRRAAEFSAALVYAVASYGEDDANATEVIRWLHEYCPHGFASRGFEVAASLGRLTYLQWLAKHHSNIVWTTALMDGAAANGHLHVLEWLRVQPMSPGCTYRAMDLAAKDGHMETVVWLHDSWVRSKRAVENAIASGHLEIAKFLLAHDHPLKVSPAMDYAAMNNHLDVLKWLHETAIAGGTKDAMDSAAGNGRLYIVQWLHTNRSEGCSVSAMNNAAGNGHLDVVQWLHDNRSEGCTRDAMDRAACQGFLEVVQWLHDNRLEGCTSDAMDGAAENGHFEVVKWLHAHRIEGCTSAAVDKAAGNGYLHIAEWIVENRGVEYTRRAMNLAAAHGHLDVVQWLHENRDEGCTTSAMDWAAANDHLDVVKWLHALRTEGCTTDAMDNAGSLAVVQWLHAHRSEGCTTKAMDSAVSAGDFDRVLFLHANRSEGCSSQVTESANYEKNVELFLWLCEHYPVAMDVNVEKAALLDTYLECMGLNPKYQIYYMAKR
ncbi:Ankyrin repeat-containing protein, partial [Globisporangium splendens]